MKRIAVIGPVFPFRGAISFCTTRLAHELSREFDVEIVSFARQYPARFYPGGTDVDDTVRHLSPPSARYGLDILNPLTWVREAWRLRRSRPDAVVLVWWIWVWALPYLIMLAILGKVPVVVQCHNVSDKEPAWWKTWLSARVFGRAHGLVVHSQAGADELLERLAPASQVKMLTLFLPVLSIGGDMPDQDSAKKSFGLRGRNVALFFGHIRPFKGLDVVLKAWPLLETDVTLLVAGEFWWSGGEEYRDLARELGIEEKILWDIRFVPDAEVARHFAAADVVVAPYRSEAQSGVAMNAFHFGRPVIATSVGGIPEIIRPGYNGFLVTPDDPQALARAIDGFFSCDAQPLRDGAEESARKYSWERFGSSVRQLVHEVT